jgi:two-component system, sensor histidine kinase PdtaS
MRIGFKLVLGFVILSIIAAGLGLWTDWTNRAVRNEVDSLAHNSIVDFADATEMQLALMSSHTTAAELLEARRIQSTAEAAPYIALIRQRLSEFRRSFARTQQKRAQTLREAAAERSDLASTSLDRARATAVDPLLEAYREHSQALERFLEAANQDNERAAEILYGELTPHLQREVLPLLESFKQSAEQQFAAGVRSVDATLTTATKRGHLVTTISLASSILLGLVFSQLIAKPLARLTATARELGRGNLSARSNIQLADEIGVLAGAIDQMATQLQSTMVSKAEVDNILQSMREMLVVTDSTGRIVTVNRSVVQMLGYSDAELAGKAWTLLFPDLADKALPLTGGEQQVATKTGKRFPVHCSGAALRSADDSVAGYVLVALDISEQKRAENALRDSLTEKELLLRELHHRVKNNLQIISSLLQLQGRETRDPIASRLLKESEARVRSMSLIHEQLYCSADLSEVDFQEYLSRLAQHLSSSSDDVRIEVQADPIRLPISQAVPCGMIVNELVTNAVEHAFPGIAGGKVTITVRIDNRRCHVSVMDDGVGIDAAAAQAHPSLGLQIVRALVDQLRAQISIGHQNGACISVSFDLDNQGQRHSSFNGQAQQTMLSS